MVRGGAVVGATGTAAARGFFNLICLGEGGARRALGVVLQARLLAQGNPCYASVWSSGATPLLPAAT